MHRFLIVIIKSRKKLFLHILQDHPFVYDHYYTREIA
jgi:hypothetical protein